MKSRFKSFCRPVLILSLCCGVFLLSSPVMADTSTSPTTDTSTPASATSDPTATSNSTPSTPATPSEQDVLNALSTISPSEPTGSQAADLSQTTGTNVGNPNVSVDSSVSSSGTVKVTTASPSTSSTSSTTPTTPQTPVSPASNFSVDPNTGQLVMTSLSPNQNPEISNIKVTGSVNNDMTGTGVMDNLEITLTANNITNDNELTPDGLHWSDDTQVIPNSQSTATGTISSANFGVDGPSNPATAYTINPGDGGRITDVGETLSGIPLDIVYTVISSDQAAWNANNTPDPGTPEGLAFTGEQYINGSDGNPSSRFTTALTTSTCFIKS